MLAKVIKLRKQFVSVGAAADYVEQELTPEEEARLLDREKEGLGVREAERYIARERAELGLYGLPGFDAAKAEDWKAARDLIDACARQGMVKSRGGEDKSDPIYHYTLNWPPGEEPSREQIEQAVGVTMRAVGLGASQALWAIHRDKDHHHVHVLANKHCPRTHKLLGPAHRDFLLLDKACREIELAQGWTHSPGPHVVVKGRVVRMTKAQRARVGKMTERTMTRQEAELAGAGSGVPSLAEHVRAHKRALESARSWDEWHDALADAGVEARLSKSGRAIVCEAYGLDRKRKVLMSMCLPSQTLPRLSERFGPYQAPAAARRVSDGYRRACEAAAAGAGECPDMLPDRRRHDTRSAQRALRAQERALLLQRWRVLHAEGAGKAVRTEQMKAMRERHKAERRALPKAKGLSGPEALAAAVEREAMFARHQRERAAVKPMSWREYVEHLASQGDAAAIAALRGMRYRERRKKDAPGFEGEDVGGHARLQLAGSISGESWGLASACLSWHAQRLSWQYADASGRVRVEDFGNRVDVVDAKDDEAMRAALLLAAAKFGGQVWITGPAEFQERARGAALEAGIRVANLPALPGPKRERAGVEL